MLNFFGFLFSLQYLRNTLPGKQTFFAGFFGIVTTSINKILLDAQIKEYNTKISTTTNTYDDSQNNTNTTPRVPQLRSLNHNHPLSLLPRNFRNIALTDFISSRPNYPQSPIRHIITQQSKIEEKYEQIIEQPHTSNFRSQKNHLFGLR